MDNSVSNIAIIVVIVSFVGHSHGQCNDTTRPLELNATGDPQYLTSPNFPASYPADSDCGWRITSDGRLIILNVQSVTTESCSYDYLQIYDGLDDSSTEVAKLCSDTMHELISSGSNLYFKFTSDYAVQYTGFDILYFVPESLYKFTCGTSMPATSAPQVLMSNNLPNTYDANVDCSWMFIATNASVLIKIKFLDLEPSSSCVNDALTFYDGDNTNASVLERVCSDASLYEFSDITSTGDTMLVVFTTNGVTAGLGFMFTVETFVATTTTSTTTTTTTTTTTLPATILSTCSNPAVNVTAETWSNYITSPNYGVSNYDNYLTCYWLVIAPNNYAVTFQLDDSFNIEYNTYCNYDYVEFYDGNSTSANKLNRFCGTSAPSTIYRTSDIYGLIVFSSDYSVVRSGFRVAYTAVDNTYPACKDPYTSYLTTYNLALTWAGTSFNTINNAEFDGSSYYSSNQDEYWLFTNDQTATHKIVLEFTYLDVERATNCIYDKVILYNGPCINDGIYDTACGSFKKRYDLVGPEYLLQFHSDALYNKRGFQMEYYAIPLPTTPPPTTTTTTNGPPVGAVIEAINELLANYSNDVLPNRDLSTAIESTVDFFLVGINGIDEVEQKMTTTGQFIVKWKDANLAWEPTRRSNIRRLLLPQDDLWRPDIALMNGFSELAQMGADFMYIDVDYTGYCMWKPYQIMDSVCQIDMTAYPYDIQECSLQFGTWSSSDSEVETDLGADGLAIHSQFQENGEWKLLESKSEVKMINSQKTIKFTFTLKRNPSFVTFYITVPTVMLAFMNAFTFVIPCESGEKSGFSITIFLSFVVVLIVVKDAMPDTSETVSLYAIYLLILTFLSAIVLMISVIQIRVLTFDENGRKLNTWLNVFVRKVSAVQSKILFCGKKKKTSDDDVKEATDEFEYGSLEEESDEAVTIDESSEDHSRSEQEYSFIKSADSEDSDVDIERVKNDDDADADIIVHSSFEATSPETQKENDSDHSDLHRSDTMNENNIKGQVEDSDSNTDLIDFKDTGSVVDSPYSEWKDEQSSDNPTYISENEQLPGISQKEAIAGIQYTSYTDVFESENTNEGVGIASINKTTITKGKPNIFQEETFFRDNCQLHRAVIATADREDAAEADAFEYKAGRTSPSQAQNYHGDQLRTLDDSHGTVSNDIEFCCKQTIHRSQSFASQEINIPNMDPTVTQEHPTMSPNRPESIVRHVNSSMSNQRSESRLSNSSKMSQRVGSGQSIFDRKSNIGQDGSRPSSVYSRHGLVLSDSGKAQTISSSHCSRLSRNSITSPETSRDIPLSETALLDTKLPPHAPNSSSSRLEKSSSVLESEEKDEGIPLVDFHTTTLLERSQSIMSRHGDIVLRPISVLSQRELEIRRAKSRLRREESILGGRPKTQLRPVSASSRNVSERSASVMNGSEGLAMTTLGYERHNDKNDRQSLRKTKAVRFPDQVSTQSSKYNDDADSVISSISSSSHATESGDHDSDIRKNDNTGDGATWADVVICSDFIFFLFFFILTLILTFAFFVRMSIV